MQVKHGMPDIVICQLQRVMAIAITPQVNAPDYLAWHVAPSGRNERCDALASMRNIEDELATRVPSI